MKSAKNREEVLKHLRRVRLRLDIDESSLRRAICGTSGRVKPLAVV